MPVFFNSKAPESPKIKLLREHDRLRPWNSLAEERVCVLCSQEFLGSDIRISAREGKPHFKCPTPRCEGTLRHFVKPGNPLLCDEVWWDWMRSMDETPQETKLHGMQGVDLTK